MDTPASPYADVMTELPPVFPRLQVPQVEPLPRAAGHVGAPQAAGVVVDRVVAGGPPAALVYETAEIPVPTAPLPRVPAPAAGSPAAPLHPSFAEQLLAPEPEPAAIAAPVADHGTGDLHDLDVSALSTAALAREALRARLLSLAAQREHRSAYELVFLMLAFAVMVLLVTPPLQTLLLALRGVQS